MKSKKPILYGIQVNFAPFDFHINVYMGDRELAKKKTKFECPDIVDGWHINGSIYIGKTKDISIITHEGVHALYYHIFQRHLPVTEENNEVMAYSMGYLVEMVMNTKIKKWFVMNNKTLKF